VKTSLLCFLGRSIQYCVLTAMTRSALIALLGVCVLSACTSPLNQTSRHTPALQLDISVSDPHRMRFSGKGAGAGMMMMSSMGPMGIAIGVAIDEGIAKDIGAAAETSGFSVEATLREALQFVWQSQATTSHGVPPKLSITIVRYGVVMRPGRDDPATAQLHVLVNAEGLAPKTYRYPEDLPENVVPDIAPLERLKNEGGEVVRLHGLAAESLAMRIGEDFLHRNVGL